MNLSENSALMTLGITQHFRIQVILSSKKSSSDSIRSVEQFRKSQTDTAKRFVKEGNYLWNAGFLFGVSKASYRLFSSILPDMFALFNEGMEQLNTPPRWNLLNRSILIQKTSQLTMALWKADNVKFQRSQF